jgi:DNA-binding response OmpR family regulator
MRHVLVADDDDRSRATIAAALRGMLLHEVADGDAALAILDRNRIDLAIIDAFVPGASVRVAACALAQGVPVLLTTNDRDLLRRFVQLAIPHLPKPLSAAQVRAEVQIIARHLDDMLAQLRGGWAWVALHRFVPAGMTGDADTFIARSLEAQRRSRRQAIRSGDLRALAESYRRLALSGRPTVREMRLRMAGQLDRWATKREWLEE